MKKCDASANMQATGPRREKWGVFESCVRMLTEHGASAVGAAGVHQ